MADINVMKSFVLEPEVFFQDCHIRLPIKKNWFGVFILIILQTGNICEL